VQYASPVVRTITDTSVNAARITITVPQLQTFTNEGDVLGSQVGLRIYVQYNGGGYTWPLPTPSADALVTPISVTT
jgi:predicted phage tail protein